MHDVEVPSQRPRLAVVAPTHPLTGGAAQFNAAMAAALADHADVHLISWKRLYPPFLHKGVQVDGASRPPRTPDAEFILDWADPRTWRRAVRRIQEAGADAVVLPWVHPVLAPPYRFLLPRLGRSAKRVLVCHNVQPHEPHPGAELLTRATVRHADLVVTHAPQQRGELASLGLGHIPRLEAFHPWFPVDDLARPPSSAEVRRERERVGRPDLLLLCYGAVRPYKGVDLALEALGRVDPGLRVKLVVAGRFWAGKRELELQVQRLGLGDRVELRDRYVTNDETALLFAASDAVLLPYRSASQSGVAAMAFAYRRPVVATAVGGLPAVVRDGENGFLCPPGDAAALARAIESLPSASERLREGVARGQQQYSFDRYARLIIEAVGRLA
jgi:glycosyltransferase involved in cell wall biosynthesis